MKSAQKFQKKEAVTEDEIDTSDYIEDKVAVDPTTIRERIDGALEELSDLKSRRDKSRSRGDIIETLSRDLSEYYGYIQELSDFLLELLSPAECVEYMDASDRPRPLVIRTNTLKTTRKDLMDALAKRGCMIEAVEWSKVAIKVTDATVPIGATPEYLAGQYMLQSAASLNPVMALAPLPGERVLDMSAAPGGKTSYIAQLMKNSGAIIANDLKPQRQKATVANLHRMGVKNAIICCYDGRKIPQVMKNFDRVLLDAPCSGLGVISRDQSVKIQRTVKDIQRIAHLQKELLCAAVDCVDHKSSTGGIIVYSTCSISSEENEQVVDYILKKRYVRLVETGLEVGKPGFTRHKERRFHPSLSLTRRFYPHVHNMDGFYVAKLQKYAQGPRVDAEDDEDEEGSLDADDVESDGADDQDFELPNVDELVDDGRSNGLSKHSIKKNVGEKAGQKPLKTRTADTSIVGDDGDAGQRVSANAAGSVVGQKGKKRAAATAAALPTEGKSNVEMEVSTNKSGVADGVLEKDGKNSLGGKKLKRQKEVADTPAAVDEAGQDSLQKASKKSKSLSGDAIVSEIVEKIAAADSKSKAAPNSAAVGKKTKVVKSKKSTPSGAHDAAVEDIAENAADSLGGDDEASAEKNQEQLLDLFTAAAEAMAGKRKSPRMKGRVSLRAMRESAAVKKRATEA